MWFTYQAKLLWMQKQVQQVFQNIQEIVTAAGGSLKVEIEAIMNIAKAHHDSFLAPKVHGPKFEQLVQQTHVTEVTPAKLNEEIKQAKSTNDKLTIIDVREESEWLNDPKLDSAIHLSKGIIERDIEKVIPNFDEPIVLYCSGGYRGRLAADALQKMGYTHVRSLQGGLRGYLLYQQEGLGSSGVAP